MNRIPGRLVTTAGIVLCASRFATAGVSIFEDGFEASPGCGWSVREPDVLPCHTAIEVIADSSSTSLAVVQNTGRQVEYRGTRDSQGVTQQLKSAIVYAAAGQPKRTLVSYDSSGRPIAASAENAGSVSFEYEPNGTVVWHVLSPDGLPIADFMYDSTTNSITPGTSTRSNLSIELPSTTHQPSDVTTSGPVTVGCDHSIESRLDADLSGTFYLDPNTLPPEIQAVVGPEGLPTAASVVRNGLGDYLYTIQPPSFPNDPALLQLLVDGFLQNTAQLCNATEQVSLDASQCLAISALVFASFPAAAPVVSETCNAVVITCGAREAVEIGDLLNQILVTLSQPGSPTGKLTISATLKNRTLAPITSDIPRLPGLGPIDVRFPGAYCIDHIKITPNPAPIAFPNPGHRPLNATAYDVNDGSVPIDDPVKQEKWKSNKATIADFEVSNNPNITCKQTSNEVVPVRLTELISGVESEPANVKCNRASMDFEFTVDPRNASTDTDSFSFYVDGVQACNVEALDSNTCRFEYPDDPVGQHIVKAEWKSPTSWSFSYNFSKIYNGAIALIDAYDENGLPLYLPLPERPCCIDVEFQAVGGIPWSYVEPENGLSTLQQNFVYQVFENRDACPYVFPACCGVAWGGPPCE